MSRGGKKKTEATLTQSMAKLLQAELVPDLKERAKMPGVDAALRQRWSRERGARRTADPYEVWIGHIAEQVGAAWILSLAFVRTLEDRNLLDRRRLAGPEAYDSEHAFFQLFPALGPRDYLLTVFRELSRLPGAEDLLGPKHNPAWRLAPSNAAAQKLLDAWRKDDASRSPLWTFEGAETRFLGDLYQDLSADARERFALLQTPDFVERFILKLTLDPAVEEFGLDEVRLIDPTCGSGHFLLGAYDRLFDLRLAREPGLDRRAHALAALAQVYGVDLNPYAIAVARFRLTLSFLAKAGIARMRDAPRLPLNLAVADSLLVAARGSSRQLAEEATDRSAWGFDAFDFEDEAEARRILGQAYQAVVGNPPYITCKDAELRELYRALYPRSAFRTFALAAPFTERFFQLAGNGGYVGLINSNSFMKREFGKKLVEAILPRLELTHVFDTSGAFIPGHGTPTVILVGRNRESTGIDVCAVLGKRGEPSVPAVPESGLVWSSIVSHFADPGYEDEFISVAKVPRAVFQKHPWSLGGGGASELKALLEERANVTLAQVCDPPIGRAARTGEDDAFSFPLAGFTRTGVEASWWRPLVTGENVRDWSLVCEEVVLFPYDEQFAVRLPTDLGGSDALRYLWPLRVPLSRRSTFQGDMEAAGLKWYEFMQYTSSANETPLSIVFSEVATHNHFALDRGGKVFKQSAPIIKMPGCATIEDHFKALALLNSSTAAYWMRQACHDKGIRGEGGGITSAAWEKFVQRSGTAVGKMPVPALTDDVARIAGVIDQLARTRELYMPLAVLARRDPGKGTIEADLRIAEEAAAATLARMCALQEELDWLVYTAFGLLTPDEEGLLRAARAAVWPELPGGSDSTSATPEHVGLHPGHRAFEVVLSREASERGEPSTWFERNGYRSPTEVATAYSRDCVRLIEARVQVIERNPRIRLIEKPEYKRRWTLRPYVSEAKAAAADWLLSAVEQNLSKGSSPVSVRAAVSVAFSDAKVGELALWLFGDDSGSGFMDLCSHECVPYLAALRFTDAGMEKRVIWERTWDLQRLEDAGEQLAGPIPPPPKYDQKDYLDPGYWRARGKLDVSKERFVSYPGAERDDDRSPVIGWAGWDHLQRAQALAALYQERKDDAWTTERLTPLLAGLLELLPWLKQWHNEPSAAFGGQRLGDYFAQYVDSEARELGLTLDDLRAWRPASKGKGRNA